MEILSSNCIAFFSLMQADAVALFNEQKSNHFKQITLHQRCMMQLMHASKRRLAGALRLGLHCITHLTRESLRGGKIALEQEG